MKLIILLLFPFSIAFGQSYDLVIKNARIVDGTGNAWYRGDIAIDKGKIAAIGEIDGRTKKTIDAQGQIVAPGFIDIHTHVEHTISSIPTAGNFIHDGVTTIITGNCGSSEVNIERFFKRLQTKPTSVNIGTLIGHNDVREFVMKKEMRSPSAAEQQRMESLVAKAMQDGALGLSTGLIYIPGTYAETSEVIGLAKAVSAEGGVYVSHIRNEGATVKEALEEAINIGREANMPVQISHFKISAKPLWGKSYETIGMVEAARKEGIDVTIDQYPYTASSTNMGTMLPSWALAGGDAETHKRLMNPAMRKKIKTEMLKELKADDRTNFDYAVIARYAPDTLLQGKSISQINKAKNRPETADSEAELIINLVDRGFAQMVFHKMSEDDVQAIVRYPFTMIASDAGVYTSNKSQPHPRGYGSNARVLGRYVRDFQALGLEEAIRKMTSLPASRFGIKNRGLLQEGYAADLVIFDENTIKDEATFDKPHAYSTGISYVIVNGEITLENGKHTGVLKGEIVRR